MIDEKDMAIMQCCSRNFCNLSDITCLEHLLPFVPIPLQSSNNPHLSTSALLRIILSPNIYNIKNTMLGWMSRCWGGFGVNSQFQRARVRSIVTDWKVPDDQDLCILINSFKGQNPEIAFDTALDMFFTHMQIDDQKNNPIFLLKHLYILDQTVQQRTALQKIATYYSSQFFAFKTGQNIQITPIRQLVATYFMYIKKKAEIYNQIDPGLFQKKQQRKKLIEKTAINEIFVMIDRCFQIQKQISQINSKYKGRNKSAEMIQVIFTMLLKTYLFCYTNVSTCAAVLFKRLNELNKTEAIRMYKFIIYFNKDYTRNFVDFVQSNKEIPIYRNIKYSQIILIEKSYVQYLENYIKGMDFSNIFPNVVNNVEEEKISNLPEELAATLEDIKVAYQSRKEYRLIPKASKEREFQEYKNLFSNDYETEYQTSVRNAYNAALEASGLKPLSDSKLFKSKKKVEYQNLSNSTRFTETTWNQWSNVYSS